MFKVNNKNTRTTLLTSIEENVFLTCFSSNVLFYNNIWCVTLKCLVLIKRSHIVKQIFIKSSHGRSFIKRGVLKNIAKFTGKHMLGFLS